MLLSILFHSRKLKGKNNISVSLLPKILIFFSWRMSWKFDQTFLSGYSRKWFFGYLVTRWRVGFLYITFERRNNRLYFSQMRNLSHEQSNTILLSSTLNEVLLSQPGLDCWWRIIHSSHLYLHLRLRIAETESYVYRQLFQFSYFSQMHHTHQFYGAQAGQPSVWCSEDISLVLWLKVWPRW